MNLVNFAREELKRLNMSEDSECEMDRMMYKSVIEVIETVAKQRHSGMSIYILLNLVEQLLQFKALTPLTGEDNEWRYIETQNGEDIYQNMRCFSVFKQGDKVTDSSGIVFEDQYGHRFYSGDSVTPVYFPYTPEQTVVKVHVDD